jgi:hypothetical protein
MLRLAGPDTAEPFQQIKKILYQTLGQGLQFMRR